VPLKILIVYSSNENERKKLLQEWAGMIEDADCFEEVADKKKQLVIFGNSQPPLKWTFYVYKNGEFNRLEN